MDTFKNHFIPVVIAIVRYVGRILATIQADFIYLLMALIIPLSIMYVGQGSELIHGIAEYSNGLNMLGILVSFYILFYCVWVVPVAGLDVLKFIDKISNWVKPNRAKLIMDRKEAMEVFQKTANYYNTGSSDGLTKHKLPMRYLANLPLSLFLMVFSYKYTGFVFGIGVTFLSMVVYLIGLFILLYFTQEWYRYIYAFLNKHFKKTNDIFIGLCFNIFLLSIVWLLWQVFPGFKFASILFCYLFLLLNNSYFYLIELGETKEENFLDKYKTLAVLVAILTVAIFIFTRMSVGLSLQNVSPIIIANIIFSFYILLLDSMLTAPSIMAKYYYQDNDEGRYKRGFLKTVNYVILFFIIKGYIHNGSIIHNMYVGNQGAPAITERVALDTYFHEWKKVNNIDSIKDTIVLVAGQGGGSRAGAWLYYNLDTLDKGKLFAVSTVSGSSNGANNFIFKKYLDLEGMHPLTKSVAEEMRLLYNYNYLSQSFWGLLFKDGLNRKELHRKTFDRNYYHQQDEMNAMKSMYVNSSMSNNDLVNISTKLDSEFNKDFIYKYYKSGNALYHLPLLFTNSATTQSGGRAICSPVATDGLFTAAIDVYDKFKQKNPSAALLTHTCVDISQSFPFTSAYAYLPDVGNFIDGGLYDNSGANTLFEIYSYLKIKHRSQKFKIILVQSDIEKSNKTNESVSLLMSTISSATNSPFTGHAYYWSEKLKNSAKLYGDESQEIILSEMKKDVPLGIYLSKATVNTIVQAGNKYWKH